MSPTVLWLLAGAVLIGIEMLVIPGIGFLFAGIAALMVGGGLELGVLDPENLIIQFAIFGVITIFTAALLWKKLKRRPATPSYDDIVGTEATVIGGGLLGTQEGQVKWSGTIMRARLDGASPMDVVPAGAHVTVRRIEGTLLYVTPKH
ncbi:MAG: NfeD family protein [Rickettsiales bacterium]